MILSRALVIFYFGHVYALSTLFEPSTCQLNANLRGLSARNLDPATILKNVAQSGFCSSEESRYKQRDESIKLAWVTPWNSHGYDLARWFASRFTHISPVWYQLVLQDDMKPELRGGHDVDRGWLQDLRMAYRPPKIVPRVQLQFSQRAAETILYYPQGQAEQLADILVAEVEKYNYDGMTLEFPAPHLFTTLIGRIGDALHDIERQLLLVIPPQHTHDQDGMIFNADHIAEVTDDVDYFAVMTYDHAGAVGREGPNAPLPWVKDVVRGLISDIEDDFDYGGDDLDDEVDDEHLSKPTRGKILIGIPFYGFKFSSRSPQAYTASDYLRLLRNENRSAIIWDEDSKEHRLVCSSGSLWYPSLLNLLYRLQFAEEQGVGIAIWELGQGLDQFVHVL